MKYYKSNCLFESIKLYVLYGYKINVCFVKSSKNKNRRIIHFYNTYKEYNFHFVPKKPVRVSDIIWHDGKLVRIKNKLKIKECEFTK